MMIRQRLIDIDKTINPTNYCKYTFPTSTRDVPKCRLDFFVGNAPVISSSTRMDNAVALRSTDQTRVMSDHKLITMDIMCKINTCTPPKTQRCTYKIPGNKKEKDKIIWSKFSNAVGDELDKCTSSDIDIMYNTLIRTMKEQMHAHFSVKKKAKFVPESEMEDVQDAKKTRHEWLKKRKKFNKNPTIFAHEHNMSVDDARSMVKTELKKCKSNVLNAQLKHRREHFKTLNYKKNKWFFSNPKKFFNAVNKPDACPSLNAVLGEGDKTGHVLFNEEVVKQTHSFYQNLYKRDNNNFTPNQYQQADGKHNISDDDNAFLSSDFKENEIRPVTDHLPNNKGVGPDGIPYEVYKYGGSKVTKFLTKMLNECVKQNYFPTNLKQGRIFLLYKNDNPFVVNNYRPITLLNTCYKIFTSVINKRLYKVVERNKLLTNEQGGFREYRACVNKIRSLINTIDDARIYGQSLHVLSIDFEKAFDSIDHDALFQSLAHKGIPNSFINIIKALYHDCFSDVITGQGITNVFKVEKGVRQGDALSPLLFNMFIDGIAEAINQMEEGYVFANNNNNLKFNCALFADDLILIGKSGVEMQTLVNKLEECINNTGLKININKTVYTHNDMGNNHVITIGGNQVKYIDEHTAFRYLGAYIRLDGSNIDHYKYVVDKIQHRINKLRFKNLTVAHASRCINSIILPVITYACEVFHWSSTQLKKLDNIVSQGFISIVNLRRVNMGT